MDEEIKSLKENNTLILVKLPENKNSVGGGGGGWGMGLQHEEVSRQQQFI